MFWGGVKSTHELVSGEDGYDTGKSPFDRWKARSIVAENNAPREFFHAIASEILLDASMSRAYVEFKPLGARPHLPFFFSNPVDVVE